MNLQCKKCGNENFYTSKSGNNTGLYCKNCGSWVKWLNKNEVKLFTLENNFIKTNTSTVTDSEQKLIKELKVFINNLDKMINFRMNQETPSLENHIATTAYCFALTQCKEGIDNIINSRDFNDFGE